VRVRRGVCRATRTTNLRRMLAEWNRATVAEMPERKLGHGSARPMRGPASMAPTTAALTMAMAAPKAGSIGGSAHPHDLVAEHTHTYTVHAHANATCSVSGCGCDAAVSA
jgi:hypothetical protein